MRSLATLAALAAVFAVAMAIDSYPTKYDNINIDAILNNNRLLNTYINCLLDKGRCNAEAQTLKTILPDALNTECVKCNPKQRANIEKVIRYVAEKKPKEWNLLVQKYDPNGEHREKHKHFFEKH